MLLGNCEYILNNLRIYNIISFILLWWRGSTCIYKHDRWSCLLCGAMIVPTVLFLLSKEHVSIISGYFVIIIDIENYNTEPVSSLSINHPRFLYWIPILITVPINNLTYFISSYQYQREDTKLIDTFERQVRLWRLKYKVEKIPMRKYIQLVK